MSKVQFPPVQSLLIVFVACTLFGCAKLGIGGPSAPPTELEGTWEGPCLFFKEVVTFEGDTYNQSVYSYSDFLCNSGTGAQTLSSGTFKIGESVANPVNAKKLDLIDAKGVAFYTNFVLVDKTLKVPLIRDIAKDGAAEASRLESTGLLALTRK